MRRHDQLQALLRRAHPQAHLPVEGRLGDVLASGRFAVTESVYFSPLEPFTSSPSIPSGETEELLARTDIGGRDGFTYPDDA